MTMIVITYTAWFVSDLVFNCKLWPEDFFFQDTHHNVIIIIIIIIIKTLFKEEAQLDLHPIFPGVLIEDNVIYPCPSHHKNINLAHTNIHV